MICTIFAFALAPSPVTLSFVKKSCTITTTTKHCTQIKMVTKIKLTNYCKKVPCVCKLYILLISERHQFAMNYSSLSLSAESIEREHFDLWEIFLCDLCANQTPALQPLFPFRTGNFQSEFFCYSSANHHSLTSQNNIVRGN